MITVVIQMVTDYSLSKEEGTKQMVSNELQIKNCNKEINDYLHLLAELKANPETEKSFFTREKCETELAKAYHRKLELMYPKAETLYMSCIKEATSAKGIELMVKYNLIESCAVAEDGEKLYAL